jgi:hypothetical protein
VDQAHNQEEEPLDLQEMVDALADAPEQGQGGDSQWGHRVSNRSDPLERKYWGTKYLAEGGVSNISIRSPPIRGFEVICSAGQRTFLISF